MTGRFEGKVALVTGGNSGIGRATAQIFAREGAKVVVAARRVSEGDETVNMIAQAGGEAIFVKTDVSRADDVEALIRKTVETYGRLDCAFNNAGVYGIEVPVHEYTEEDWEYVMSINLKGVWLCMRSEIRWMLKHGGGAIVNDSSTSGLVGGLRESAYVASKHGVIGLTKAAALEYARHGIRVNAVCPGWIRTPMVDSIVASKPEREELAISKEPIGRMGTPDEVAEAAVWLCSDAASFVTGHSMAVDGGILAE